MGHGAGEVVSLEDSVGGHETLRRRGGLKPVPTATGHAPMTGHSIGAVAMDTAIAMPVAPRWQSADVLVAFMMWVVMMVAMMTPAAAPCSSSLPPSAGSASRSFPSRRQRAWSSQAI